MADKLRKLELLRVFQSDAAEIIDARERAITVHHTADIDAAGDEVEEAVRRVVRRKLPAGPYVGHGHIVDSSLSVSPQLDIIIADNKSTPILFRTENGTEYFPFESVYAFGEVKSTYYKSKSYIEHFSGVIHDVRANLRREPTPPTYVGDGFELGSGFSVSEKRPFRNPLFTFMIFANGGDFQPSDMKDFYRTTAVVDLPNLVCILDRGIIVKINVVRNEKGRASIGSLIVVPEMHAAVGGTGAWAFIPFGGADIRPASNLAAWWFTILAHLGSTTLMVPDMLSYLGHAISYGEGEILG